MSKPRLTTDLLERIRELYDRWEFNATQVGEDEETHWDNVKHYRPIDEWAKAQLEKRKLRKESKNYPKERVLTPEDEEEADQSARAMAASIIRMRREREEDNDER